MNKVVVGGLGLFCLISAASVFGRTVWIFELLTHFRLQYVIAGALLAVTLALYRRWIGAVVAVGLAAANAVPVLPYIDAPPRAASHRPDAAVRVMLVNLRHRFGDMDVTARLIRAEQPDIVLLTELLPAHLPALRALGDILPHRVGTPPRSIFDVVLMSRMAIASSRIRFPASRMFPVIEARLCREPGGAATCLTVIAMHAPRPEFRSGEDQIKTFTLVAERAAAVRDRRVVVMGDLNTTPYSPRFRDLARRGGLTDAAIGAPWRTTWISRFPPFGLTLDHVLLGAALRPLGRRVADGIGSDHFPVIVDLALE